MLIHWADNIIIPGYADFKVSFDNFAAKAEAFSSGPDPASLQALRQSWEQAYLEWQKVELFEFGPADRYTLRNFFNIYPADVAGIEENILNASANLDVPASYPRQGFPALDYLINGIADDDESIVARYTTDANAPFRIAYLQRIVDRMNTLLSNVISEWNGAYRNTFVSKTGLDIGSSTGIVVNAFVLHYERYIRSGKFGIPSGATISGGEPHPDKVEAFYRHNISRDLAAVAHQAAADFFNGVSRVGGQDGPSFKSYLDALNAKDDVSSTPLSDLINAQFENVDSKVNALQPSLYDQITADNQAMIEVYTEMQKTVRMLKVDMTSAMSVTITYTDNDGD